MENTKLKASTIQYLQRGFKLPLFLKIEILNWIFKNSETLITPQTSSDSVDLYIEYMKLGGMKSRKEFYLKLKYIIDQNTYEEANN